MNDPSRQSLHWAVRGVGLGLFLGSGLFLSQPVHAESEKEAIQQVVSGYYDALSRGPTEAASFYGEPAVVVLPNEVLPLNKRADVEAFLTKLLSPFKSLGFSHATVSDPRIKMLSETAAIFSTVAIRYKTDGSELPRGGFTYLLHKGPSGWKIHELVATDIDKLVSPN
jgi:ketosteroid isomerase-like protein